VRTLIYIVLFKDGAISPFFDKPNKADFQEGTRLFVAEAHTPLFQILQWIRDGYAKNDWITETEFA
jgi:hypothetical protein